MEHNVTYRGTWKTLVDNCGLPEDEAKQVEKAYHDFYKVSDEYTNQHLKLASKQGYLDIAFGLRLRTPRMYQSVDGTRITPSEVEKEKRTINNAIGQSWGMLTTRALTEINKAIYNSKYKYLIKPVNQIHDALYFLVPDDAEAVCWFNKVVTKAFSWQKDERIKHNEVHLGGDLSIFYPDWAHELVLPHDIEPEDLVKLVNDYINKKET